MKKLSMFAGGMSLALLSGVSGYYFYQHQLKADTSASPAENMQTNINTIVKSSDMVGLQRPEFSLKNVDGELRHINEWDGNVIALNFWATWCPPCLKEIPEFIHLQEKYLDKGLQFIGVALQEAEPVKQFMREHGMNYPVLAGELEVIKIAKSYGNNIGALPYTVIIGRDGKIAFVKPGPLSGEAAEAVITDLL